MTNQLRIFNIPISDEDARHLVATLIADGGPDAMVAAQLIGNGADIRLSPPNETLCLPASRIRQTACSNSGAPWPATTAVETDRWQPTS